jgi:hypothetical protein
MMRGKMSRRRRTKPKKGDVFTFPLAGRKHGYGHVLAGALAGFYAVETADELSIEAVIQRDVAFRVPCSSAPFSDGRWQIIGNAEPLSAMRAAVRFWRQTAPGVVFLYEAEDAFVGGDERRVSESEIVEVEKHGVWESDQVVRRLKSFLRGKT